MTRCIWCLEERNEAQPVEHIVPEALGCPEPLVLRRGEVCGGCNTRVSRLDARLAHEHELFTFFGRVRGKAGKPPTIASIGNAAGGRADGGYGFHVNMSKQAKHSTFGRKVAPYRGQRRDVKMEFQEPLPPGGGVASVTMRFELYPDRSYTRAIFKIALEALTFYRCADCVCLGDFDHVRDYVIRDQGDLRAIMLSRDGSPSDYQSGVAYAEGAAAMILIQLGPLAYYVDLTRDQADHKKVVATALARGQTTGWTELPKLDT